MRNFKLFEIIIHKRAKSKNISATRCLQINTEKKRFEKVIFLHQKISEFIREILWLKVL